MMWWIILGVTVLMSFGAMAYLKSTFAKASQVPVASGMTGAQAAARILQWAGISDVEIVEGDSFLGDHYDPLHKTLVLSPDNYSGSSAANVGVAAHECGHALQHQQHYIPLEIRMGSVYATNYASTAVMWIPIIAIFFHVISMYTAIWIMALCFGVIMFFNLITLPVEFDASARAKVVLQQLGIVRPGEEAAAVNSTLNAAGLTYVAAFIGSLLQFLYYVMLLMNDRRN
ncbi:MAG TPA: zinc metallopeptidase [Candidatus Methylacidiphilales bacterium]